MTTQNPFSPNFSKTKSISATSTTASVTLDSSDTGASGNSIMRIVNAGPNTAFLRWGVGAQTALATDMPMLSGTIEVFTKGPSVDTVAAICASTQTATIYITCGEGQ